MNLDKMKKYYEEGFWSINRLKILLAAGKITQEDYDYITSSDAENGSAE